MRQSDAGLWPEVHGIIEILISRTSLHVQIVDTWQAKQCRKMGLLSTRIVGGGGPRLRVPPGKRKVYQHKSIPGVRNALGDRHQFSQHIISNWIPEMGGGAGGERV